MSTSEAKALVVQPDAIADAVRLIVGAENVTELRALDATSNSDRWPSTLSGYFDDPDKLARAVREIRSAKGIYFTPNPVNPDLLARAANRIRKAPKGESTQDTNILRRRWLLIDCDAVRVSGISSTDVEHEAALDRCRTIRDYLAACGWPEPILADSGNGGHLLFYVDLSTDDDGLVEGCLMGLSQRYDDESVKVDKSVFNPARIWKLYGTSACKGDSTVERPHRLAMILSRPATLEPVATDLLKSLAAEVCVEEPRNDTVDFHGNGVVFDLVSFIQRNGLDVEGPGEWNGSQGRGRRWTFRTSPMCDHHGDGPYLLEHASGAISSGCHHDSCSWDWKDLRAKYEPKTTSAISSRSHTNREESRPEVYLPGGMIPINKSAARLGELLAKAGRHFFRGGVVVTLSHDEEGMPVLVPLKPPTVASDFEKVAKLQRNIITKQGRKTVPAICTESTARLILHAETFVSQLPVIRVVTRCPVLIERNDQLIQVIGCDRDSGIFAAGKPATDIPLNEAKQQIEDLLADFLFPTPGDKSRAVAAILTPALVLGGLLRGRPPGDLGEADLSQAGKGFRNKLTAAIYNSKIQTVVQRKGGVGSLEESFNSALVTGRNFISLDNVRGKLDSQAVESFMTEDIYGARIPYHGEVEIDPKRVILMFTSNRAEVTRDLANRSSVVRILKRDEGYLFKEYPEENILEHVRANSEKYLGAVYAVIRAWYEKGKPRTKETRHDFRPWCQTLDWIVQNIFGMAPLMDGHQETQLRITSRSHTWLRDVAMAVERVGRLGQPLRAHHLLDIIVEDGEGSIPGMSGDDLDNEEARGKLLLAVGRWMSKCFEKKDKVVVDSFTVERSMTPDEQYRTVRGYRFSRDPAIAPHDPAIDPSTKHRDPAIPIRESKHFVEEAGGAYENVGNSSGDGGVWRGSEVLLRGPGDSIAGSADSNDEDDTERGYI